MLKWDHSGSSFNGIVGMIDHSLMQGDLHTHCTGVFCMNKAVA